MSWTNTLQGFLRSLSFRIICSVFCRRLSRRPAPACPQEASQSVMSSSRSLSGELLCLYSVVLDSRFQLQVSFWLPMLCERPSWARRLDGVLSSESSATLQWARSEAGWWKSWRRFSRFRAQGPSFCQFTLWKAMMQCRLPPTCHTRC